MPESVGLMQRPEGVVPVAINHRHISLRGHAVALVPKTGQSIYDRIPSVEPAPFETVSFISVVGLPYFTISFVKVSRVVRLAHPTGVVVIYIHNGRVLLCVLRLVARMHFVQLV